MQYPPHVPGIWHLPRTKAAPPTLEPVMGIVTSDDLAALNVLVTQNITGTTNDHTDVPKPEVKDDTQEPTTPMPGTTSAPAHGKPKATAAGGSERVDMGFWGQ